MRWLLLFLLLPQAWAQVDPAWLWEAASRLAGYPYRWGGEGWGGFDCSGLVRYLYRHLGVDLPRTSREQYQALPKAEVLLPGTLLFFSESRREVDHVAVFLGASAGRLWILHASGRRGKVVVEPLDPYLPIYVGARRPR